MTDNAIIDIKHNLNRTIISAKVFAKEHTDLAKGLQNMLADLSDGLLDQDLRDAYAEATKNNGGAIKIQDAEAEVLGDTMHLQMMASVDDYVRAVLEKSGAMVPNQPDQLTTPNPQNIVQLFQ